MTYSPPASLLAAWGLSGLPAGVWTGSNVFPWLQGQDIDLIRTPILSSAIKTASSGRERRTAFWSYPRWRYQVRENVIRDRVANPELAVLESFFLTQQGRVTEFKYLDPDRYQATLAVVGTGTGSRTVFQLMRQIEGYSEPVLAPYTGTGHGITVYVNGVLNSNYSISDAGVLTFAVAPANGAVVTWSGYYYMLCRFEQDEAQLRKMFLELWSCDKLAWISVKL